tara:strand:- start:6945 stop:8129 length:1185 start_codon:yes stop_codon:yes gene_type:complete
MVVKEDIEQYKIFWKKFLKENDKYIKTVAIHSPDNDSSIFKEIFKGKELFNVSIKKWNLNNKINVTFDLLILNNIIMYSKTPEKWFKNIFNSCKFVIIEDLIDRNRNNDKGMKSQLSIGDSEDSMRYSFSHLNVKTQSDVSFDISKLKNRIINVNFYKTEAPSSKHFICSFKGDKSLSNDKIIRIDDFPTGIRPILDDLEPLYDILMEFEKRELRFVLGIVPSLLTEDMIERLKKFKYLIVAQHGYNHNYEKLHKKLIDNKDPYNDWCCMDQFNEFTGKSKDEIKDKMEFGRNILEKIGPTNIYIPPCNNLDKNTLEVLEDLDFKYILGDGISHSSKKIPIISSNFYNRVRMLNRNNSQGRVSCLHVTWEWDELYRRKDISKPAWDKNLDLLIN